MQAIGRALMSGPKLLILDEPSQGIASNLAWSILKTLALLRDQGMTVLLVEQIVQDALAVADRGYVIQTGRIAISGKAEKLLQSDWCAKLIWGCREAVFIFWKGAAAVRSLPPSFSGIRSGINSSLPDHQPLWDKFILASLELFATIVV